MFPKARETCSESPLKQVMLQQRHRHGEEFEKGEGSSKCKGKNIFHELEGDCLELDSADEVVECCFMENWRDAELFWLLFSLSRLLSGIGTFK